MHLDNEGISEFTFLDSAMQDPAWTRKYLWSPEEKAALRPRRIQSSKTSWQGDNLRRQDKRQPGQAPLELGAESGSLVLWVVNQTKAAACFCWKTSPKEESHFTSGNWEKWLFLLNHVNTSVMRKLLETQSPKYGTSIWGRQEGSTGTQEEKYYNHNWVNFKDWWTSGKVEIYQPSFHQNLCIIGEVEK